MERRPISACSVSEIAGRGRPAAEIAALQKRVRNKHLRQHLREWFWFLLDPTIDATNYGAEQVFRFGVTNHKVWGGNRTPPGSVTQAILGYGKAAMWES